ncbi:hypothetical protein ONS96_008811 [Cadophora gregata f. sp. sojae]|nr:hypothetical protein ONS96_008811 [Cadophora gregata f. sp. sojae]
MRRGFNDEDRLIDSLEMHRESGFAAPVVLQRKANGGNHCGTGGGEDGTGHLFHQRIVLVLFMPQGSKTTVSLTIPRSRINKYEKYQESMVCIRNLLSAPQ